MQTSQLHLPHTRFIAHQSLTLHEYGILRFFAPVTSLILTFIYELYLYPLKMSPQTKNELSTSRFSKVIVLQTDKDIQTDATENITTPLCGSHHRESAHLTSLYRTVQKEFAKWIYTAWMPVDNALVRINERIIDLYEYRRK